MNSRRAISGLDSPRPTRSRTCCSRRVSGVPVRGAGRPRAPSDRSSAAAASASRGRPAGRGAQRGRGPPRRPARGSAAAQRRPAQAYLRGLDRHLQARPSASACRRCCRGMARAGGGGDVPAAAAAGGRATKRPRRRAGQRGELVTRARRRRGRRVELRRTRRPAAAAVSVGGAGRPAGAAEQGRGARGSPRASRSRAATTSSGSREDAAASSGRPCRSRRSASRTDAIAAAGPVRRRRRSERRGQFPLRAVPLAPRHQEAAVVRPAGRGHERAAVSLGELVDDPQPVGRRCQVARRLAGAEHRAARPDHGLQPPALPGQRAGQWPRRSSPDRAAISPAATSRPPRSESADISRSTSPVSLARSRARSNSAHAGSKSAALVALHQPEHARASGLASAAGSTRLARASHPEPAGAVAEVHPVADAHRDRRRRGAQVGCRTSGNRRTPAPATRSRARGSPSHHSASPRPSSASGVSRTASAASKAARATAQRPSASADRPAVDRVRALRHRASIAPARGSVDRCFRADVRGTLAVMGNAPDTFQQVPLEVAESYEAVFVPALFAPLAPLLVEVAGRVARAARARRRLRDRHRGPHGGRRRGPRRPRRRGRPQRGDADRRPPGGARHRVPPVGRGGAAVRGRRLRRRAVPVRA